MARRHHPLATPFEDQQGRITLKQAEPNALLALVLSAQNGDRVLEPYQV